MRKRSFALSCRVHRHPEVRVVRPLAQDRETLFLQGEDQQVAEELTLISLEEDSQAEGLIGLQELLLVLWPGALSTVDRKLKKTRAIDNRVDLEQSLCGWADLLLALRTWWASLESPYRHSLERTLQQYAPLVADLLAGNASAGSLELGVHLQRPVSESFPEIFFAPVPPPPKADEEAWQTWRAREVEEILGENGGLARILGEGFEARAGQLDMAVKTEQVLARDEHLMIEAGTGIGKSLAYLVPALLHGAREDERVVISTYTKALQHQLIEGDLPVLERFGYPAQARLLLGRNNYLCARQFRRAMLHRCESRAEALAQLAIFCWRFQSRDGRREELSDHPFFEDHWLALFESVEPCSPHICHKDPLCFVVAARRSAREAPVVIVNHSLLMMDLRSAQGLLGPSRLLIVDEAHELPPVATNALSHWIKRDRLEVYRNLSGEKTRGGLREVFEEILKIVGERPGGDRLRECTRALDAALDAWYNAYHRWFDAVEESCRSRLSEGSARAGRHRYHDGDEAFGAVRSETEVLLERAEELHRDLAKVLDASGDLAELLPEMQDDREALVSLLSFHSDLCEGIEFCLEASDEDWVYWFEWGGTRGLSAIVAAPLTVEEPLSQLWDTHYRSVIMTSATLAVGEDFTPFAESVGFSKVSRYTESLLIPSPFHFEEQALVLTTPELVDPKEEGFPELVAQLLQQIGTRVATKTLMLSTSYQLIDEIYEILRPVFSLEEGLFSEESGHARTRLLRQTPGGSRERLVAEFRDAEAAILLATGSFWEGVDFPGRQLEVLVVPRLPFAVPTEPLTQGRFDRAKRLGRDPFLDVSLNDAVLRLKQGVGRLLRTREDRGVVLLLDKRLQERSYGVTFLRSMPRSCEWVPSRAEMAQRVVDFLSKP